MYTIKSILSKLKWYIKFFKRLPELATTIEFAGNTPEEWDASYRAWCKDHK